MWNTGSSENKATEKFGALKQYLLLSRENNITLSFEEIESIIKNRLCKSAYSYQAYWRQSYTHIMPNTIIEAGYEIASVDLIAKKIELKKQDS